MTVRLKMPQFTLLNDGCYFFFVVWINDSVNAQIFFQEDVIFFL
jgi:hypothetical protein